VISYLEKICPDANVHFGLSTTMYVHVMNNLCSCRVNIPRTDVFSTIDRIGQYVDMRVYRDMANNYKAGEQTGTYFKASNMCGNFVG
jgi:hypothetical protein